MKNITSIIFNKISSFENNLLQMNYLIQCCIVYFLGVTVAFLWFFFIEVNLQGAGFEEGYESGKYWIAALDILEVGDIDPNRDRLPGYPIFIVLIFLLFGVNNFTAIVVTQCFLAGFSVLAVSLSASSFNRKWFWRGSILAILWPNLLYPATMILPDFLFTLLFVWAVTFLLLIRNSGKLVKLLIFSGIFLGLAYLVRPAMLLFPFTVLPFLAYLIYKETKISYFKSVIYSAIPIIIMMSFTIPQYMKNHKAWGHYVFSIQTGDHAHHMYSCLTTKWGCGEANSEAFYKINTHYEKELNEMSESEKNNGAIRDKLRRELAKEYIREIETKQLLQASIGSTVKLMAHTIYYSIINRIGKHSVHFSEYKNKNIFLQFKDFIIDVFSSDLMLVWLIFQIALIFTRMLQINGLIVGIRNDNYKARTLLLLAITITFLMISVGFGNPRYRVPIEPLLILLTVLGISNIVKQKKV